MDPVYYIRKVGIQDGTYYVDIMPVCGKKDKFLSSSILFPYTLELISYIRFHIVRKVSFRCDNVKYDGITLIICDYIKLVGGQINSFLNTLEMITIE